MSRSKEKKFSIGDPVKFREGITNESMGTNNPRLDLKKEYHISFVESDDVLHLSEAPSYIFSPEWPEPAEDEPKDEPKTLGEQVNSALEDFLTGIADRHKTILKPGDHVVVLKDDIKDFGKSVGMEGSKWIDAFPDKPLKIEQVIGPAVILEGFPHYYLHQDWVRLADKVEVREKALGIKDVIFKDPATIVFWTDGTKTVVKCRKGDKWDAEKGLAMACAKKLLGNRDGYHKALKKLYTTGGNWQKEMSTEAIRAAVSTGCIRNGCENCPCCPDRGGKCYIIALADRDQLITMLEAFEKADKWSYDDWRMSHA